MKETDTMKLKSIDVGKPAPLLRRVNGQEKFVGKANVAWFKLSEFIQRGEKERALNLLRLLTHSLSDQAFLKKLEADIWFSFDKIQAESYYNNAAHLYKENGKVVEALIVYELLAKRYPETINYIEKVIQLSGQLKWNHKKELFESKLYKTFLIIGKVEKAFTQFTSIEKQLKDADIFAFHRAFVVAALTHKYTEQKLIGNSLYKALEGLLRSGEDKELQQFLEETKALNGMWHKDAIAYLKEQA